MSYFRKKWSTAFLLCYIALLKRAVNVEGFSPQSTVRRLSQSQSSSHNVLHAQNDDGDTPLLQDLIDETIESNRKLVSATCSDSIVLGNILEVYYYLVKLHVLSQSRFHCVYLLLFAASKS